QVVAARKARALHRDVEIQFSDDERQQMQ
ncbi:hypothetical protein E3A20_28720, partial [Planctomyces bekefii]